MTTSGAAATPCAVYINGPITTNTPHAQLHAQRSPAMQQDLLLARGGSSCLYRHLLGAVCSGRCVVERRRKPHPEARLHDRPALRAFSICTKMCPALGHITRIFGSHLMGHHMPIAVPTAGAVAVEAFCSSDGLCWHTNLCAKHVPNAQAAAVEAFRSSDRLCWSEAHPRAPGLKDDVEEPTSTCPLWDASQAMPGHPTPSPLSSLLQRHATLVAGPTSAIERHALAPPKPLGPT